MGYVEFLRARKALLIYGCILAAILVCVVFSLRTAVVHHGSGGTNITLDPGDAARGGNDSAAGAVSNTVVPLSAIFGCAAYAAIIFAIIVGRSLSKENDRGGYAFTKPISRQRLALNNFAIDGIGIVLAFGLAFLCVLLGMASIGLLPRLLADPGAATVAFLGLGVAFMWYALLQAATASLRANTGWISGFSWAFFAGLIALTHATFLGPAVHALVWALNLLNPLAYMTGVTSTDGGHSVTIASVFAQSDEVRAVIAWCLAIAFCAVATLEWKRVEV